jgi:hypothetical protein
MNNVPTMTQEQQQKTLLWIDKIQTIRLELDSLYSEFDAVAARRLELKHSIESKEAKIAKLEKRGPLSSEIDEDDEDDQRSLFDAPVEEDSIAELNLPKRIRQKLEKSQVTTMTRLQNIVDGLDREFANLESIFGNDHDAVKRIESTLRDEDEEESPETVSVPYGAPVPTAAVKAEVPSSDKSAIKLKIAMDDMEIGTVCEATLTGNGQAVLEDGTLLESGEFELAEVAEAV